MKIALVLPILVMMCGIARADVAAVRREVARINALKLSTKSTDRADFSSEDAQILVGRDAKGSPRKIVAHILGETGRRADTMYLQNGKPLFRFSVEDRYAEPIGVSSRVKVFSHLETRLYFDSGRLIQKRVGKKIVTLTRAQKQKIEFQTFEDVKGYLSEDEGRRSTY